MAELYQLSQELFHNTGERDFLARMEEATWKWFDGGFGHNEACCLMQKFRKEKLDRGLIKEW